MSDEYQEIPIDAIDNPARPLRDQIDDEELDQLIFSIATYGLLQPISVLVRENRFEVLVGHRRLEAVRRLGWQFIRARVYDSEQKNIVEIRMHENLHRAPLKPTEEARNVLHFHQELGWPLHRIATAMARSIPWVTERLDMAAWPYGLRELVDQKKVSIGVANTLMEIDDDNTLEYLSQQAAEAGATIAQARAWVLSYQRKPWKLPTREEVAEMIAKFQPPPVPMAYCFGCDGSFTIDLFITAMLCPTCTAIINQRRSQVWLHTKPPEKPVDS